MSEHISIDTDDLACSIDRVTEQVEATTSAVEDVGRAVCAAEREAAEHVCRSVDRGFFTLIRTQILQKKVQVQTTVEAKLLSLRHCAQALRTIQKQMGVDFERITLRYSKLFNTLAEALRSRVYALDQAAVSLAEDEYGVLDRRIMTAAAPAVVLEQDSVSAMAQLTAVRCKKDCRSVVGSVKEMIVHGIELDRAMREIARDKPLQSLTRLSVPFLVCECSDLYLENSNQTDFLFSSEIPEELVLSRMKGMCYQKASKFKWTDAPAGFKARVVSRVRDMIDREDCAEHVKALILAMLEGSSLKRLEAVE